MGRAGLADQIANGLRVCGRGVDESAAGRPYRAPVGASASAPTIWSNGKARVATRPKSVSCAPKNGTRRPWRADRPKTGRALKKSPNRRGPPCADRRKRLLFKPAGATHLGAERSAPERSRLFCAKGAGIYRRGRMIVLWDGSANHKGSLLRDLLARYPRLQLEPLPAYAPQLNPAEFV